MFLTAAVSIAVIAEPYSAVMHLRSVPDSQIVTKAQPVYPPDAADARIQGVVRIRILIGTNGHVQSAHLLSGNKLLAPAALQAVRQRVYKPFESQGKPVRVMTEVEIPFALP